MDEYIPRSARQSRPYAIYPSPSLVVPNAYYKVSDGKILLAVLPYHDRSTADKARALALAEQVKREQPNRTFPPSITVWVRA